MKKKKSISKMCKDVVAHLKRDSKTWMGMSKKAKRESRDDQSLIRKIKKVV
jgi:hypothetical protein